MHNEKRVECEQKGSLDIIGKCHHPVQDPMKYKDPGCPTILVNIEGTCVEKALLDLGVSVNLLPYSVYK